MSTRTLFPLAACLFLSTWPLAADAQQYAARIRFQGGPATGDASLWIKVTDTSGVDIASSNRCCIHTGDVPESVLDAFTSDGNCGTQALGPDELIWNIRPPTYCYRDSVDVLRLQTNQSFRCFASSDSSTWSEITPSQSFTVVDITLASDGSLHAVPVPALSAWGQATLSLLLALAAFAVLRRHRPPRPHKTFSRHL